MYSHEYSGPRFDWPEYGPVRETPEQVEHCRLQYAALLTMCDAYLGKFLDFMEENDMWKDTMVIVNTDHGFLLGEHDSWAKSVHPWYNEMVHLPMFIWDPRHGITNERRNTLVQNIDVPITLLRAFGLSPSKDMMGHDLEPVIARDQKVRDYALFGMHGAQVNITDGRYVYMRSSVAGNEPLYNYTQMPTHMRCRFSVAEMKTMRPHHGFSFTKGTPVMRISAMEDASGDTSLKKNPSTVLFDLLKDPGQTYPINDQKTEVRMIQNMIELMKDNDAPREQYIRLGLDAYF